MPMMATTAVVSDAQTLPFPKPGHCRSCVITFSQTESKNSTRSQFTLFPAANKSVLAAAFAILTAHNVALVEPCLASVMV